MVRVFGASLEAAKINIARAAVALGLASPCILGRHEWITAGGRQCPRRPDDDQGRCSQTVYRCRHCPAYDYGEPGGPAFTDCFTFGPCDPWECQPRAEILDDVDTAIHGAGIPTLPATMLEHRRP